MPYYNSTPRGYNSHGAYGAGARALTPEQVQWKKQQTDEWHGYLRANAKWYREALSDSLSQQPRSPRRAAPPAAPPAASAQPVPPPPPPPPKPRFIPTKLCEHCHQDISVLSRNPLRLDCHCGHPWPWEMLAEGVAPDRRLFAHADDSPELAADIAALAAWKKAKTEVHNKR